MADRAAHPFKSRIPCLTVIFWGPRRSFLVSAISGRSTSSFHQARSGNCCHRHVLCLCHLNRCIARYRILENTNVLILGAGPTGAAQLMSAIPTLCYALGRTDDSTFGEPRKTRYRNKPHSQTGSCISGQPLQTYTGTSTISPCRTNKGSARFTAACGGCLPDYLPSIIAVCKRPGLDLRRDLIKSGNYCPLHSLSRFHSITKR